MPHSSSPLPSWRSWPGAGPKGAPLQPGWGPGSGPRVLCCRRRDCLRLVWTAAPSVGAPQGWGAGAGPRVLDSGQPPKACALGSSGWSQGRPRAGPGCAGLAEPALGLGAWVSRAPGSGPSPRPLAERLWGSGAGAALGGPRGPPHPQKPRWSPPTSGAAAGSGPAHRPGTHCGSQGQRASH